MMKYERLTKRTETGGVKYAKNGIYAEDICERLAELEDKIEHGTLIELPCKVGDTVYKLCSVNSNIKMGQMWDGKIVKTNCNRCAYEHCPCYDIGVR